MMAYLTTSQVSLFELQGETPEISGSPFFNIFRTVELLHFEPHQSHNFLEMRFESVVATFPKDLLEHILELSENEPHKLQLVGECAYHEWCNNAGKVLTGCIKKIEDRFSYALSKL